MTSTNQKAYVIWWDNNEPYEDNFKDILAVFSSYEKAIEFIEQDMKYKKIKYYNKYRWVVPDGEHYDDYVEIREFIVDSKMSDYPACDWWFDNE